MRRVRGQDHDLAGARRDRLAVDLELRLACLDDERLVVGMAVALRAGAGLEADDEERDARPEVAALELRALEIGDGRFQSPRVFAMMLRWISDVPP
jgi:hypothetical protein